MKQFYACVLLVLLLPAVAATSFAQSSCNPTITNVSPANVLYRAFEARWKGLNNTNGVNTALYLGNNNMGSGGTNRVETNGNGLYNKPGTTAISLSYSTTADQLVATVGTRTVTYTNISTRATGNMAVLNFMHIQLRSGTSSAHTGTVQLNNITLNSTNLGNISVPANNTNNWTISNFDFSQSFTFTANIVLDNGLLGNNEGAKVDIWVGNNNVYPCNVPANTAFSGTIWFDKNGNGVKESFETAPTGSYFVIAKHSNGPNAGKVAANTTVGAGGAYTLQLPNFLVLDGTNYVDPTYEVNVTNFLPAVGSNYGSPASGDLGAPAGSNPYYVTNPASSANPGPFSEIGRFDVMIQSPYTAMTDMNAGLQSPPSTDDVNTALPARPVGTYWMIDNDDQVLTGIDFEDGLFESGLGKTFRILSNPTNSGSIVIRLAYDGNNNGPDASDIIDASADPDDNVFFDIPNYDRNRLYVFFQSGTGSYTGSFAYTAVDQAGAASPTAALYSFTALLPINGLDLSGSYASGRATLRWTVKNIDEADHFVLERSVANGNFKQVAVTQLAGLSYHFVDELQGFSGSEAFYRVKMVRKNGNVSYSNVVNVKLAAIAGIQFTPTMVRSDLQIRFNNPKAQDINIRVVSMGGQIVANHRMNASAGNVSLNVPGFERIPNGTYTVQVFAGNDIQQGKIVVQH